mmetsp:Transcript_24987/g.54101  ORF Transcript_24987/g.54101 Transcript_24987/m.54101 type:complete len:874 (-) Transcript_24987:336-2957(-)
MAQSKRSGTFSNGGSSGGGGVTVSDFHRHRSYRITVTTTSSAHDNKGNTGSRSDNGNRNASASRNNAVRVNESVEIHHHDEEEERHDTTHTATPQLITTAYEDDNQVEVTFSGGVVQYQYGSTGAVIDNSGDRTMNSAAMDVSEQGVLMTDGGGVVRCGVSAPSSSATGRSDEFQDSPTPDNHGITAFPSKKRRKRGILAAARLSGRVRSDNGTAGTDHITGINVPIDGRTQSAPIFRAVAADHSESITVTSPDLANHTILTDIDNDDTTTKAIGKISSSGRCLSATDSDTSSSYSAGNGDDFSSDAGVADSIVLAKKRKADANAVNGDKRAGRRCGWARGSWCQYALLMVIVILFALAGVLIYSAKKETGWFLEPNASAHEKDSSPIDDGVGNAGNDNNTTISTTASASPKRDNALANVATASPSSPPTQSPISSVPTYGPSSPPTLLPTQPPSLEPSQSPTLVPTDPRTYVPGDLTKYENGLILSTGLSSRIVATSGEKVELTSPTVTAAVSAHSFHRLPDAAAVFPHPDGWETHGWIYTSNSEVPDGAGGVGSVFFDQSSRVTDYVRVLRGTSKNCGGGATPWKTWISCEENGDGQLYEVDPTGKRPAKITVLGQSFGGNYESFTYDDRDPSNPRFFYTEDKTNGALRRFTPHPDAVTAYSGTGDEAAFNLLHSPDGTFEYLVFDMVAGDRGTFRWSTDIAEGRQSADDNYINTEGIDARNGRLVFVSKKQRELFILELDEGTWSKSSTSTGVFDGQPDQVNYMLEYNKRRKLSEFERPPMLIFTEEGGKRAGIHGRDGLGNYLTLVESMGNWAETTGLSFSPDYKHMYFAFQEQGILYDVWREDGYSFDANVLDLKYHYVSDTAPAPTN